MILQLGIGMICIWLMNHGYILREVLRSTPNWLDTDINAEQIVQNFIANTPLEQIKLIVTIAHSNKFFGPVGLLFLIAAIII